MFFHREEDLKEIARFLISLKQPIVVVLDEYNELKDSYGGKETGSMMQKIIDGLKGTDVCVIISGSAVTVMSELLDSSNPLFDRFDSVLHIHGFDYLESAAFIPRWSNRDKASCYSVFGGSPASLENVDPDSSLEENIKRLLLDPRGSCHALVENTLLREYSKIGPALSILGRIGNGRRTYGELRDAFDQRNTGNLSSWLAKMTANDALIRSCPINDRDNPRKAFYSISDNLFRFYFAYVHPNRSRIERVGADTVYESMVRPSLDTYISYRFEDIAAQYFPDRQWREGFSASWISEAIGMMIEGRMSMVNSISSWNTPMGTMSSRPGSFVLLCRDPLRTRRRRRSLQHLGSRRGA